jgi:hypothetical protein
MTRTLAAAADKLALDQSRAPSKRSDGGRATEIELWLEQRLFDDSADEI